MGLYSGGTLTKSGLYGGGTLTGRPKAKSEPSGVGGFLENLGSDVTDAIMGLGPGLVKAVKDPVETAKAIGGSYKQTYGPLFSGDYGKFFGEVYKHPLGPLLDLATVITLGGGAAGRAGGTLGKAGTLTLESPGAKAGIEGALTITRSTARNPVIRGRQVALDRFMKMFPAETPIVGEFQRLARELERIPRREAQRLRLAARPYQKAYTKLNEAEQIALGLIGRGLTAEEYKALLVREAAAGAKVEPATLALLDRADVRAAAANPSPRLVDAAEKARAAGQAAADILVSRKLLQQETVAERPYLAARVARAEDVRGAPAQPTLFPLDDLEVQAGLAPIEDVLRTAPSAEAVRQAFDAEGRIQPFFLPDRMTVDRAILSRSGGGAGVPTRPVGVHRNEALLLRTGRIALQPDVLTGAYMGAVKYALYEDIHNLLLQSGVHVSPGEPLPKGYVYLRRPVGRTKRAEKIPYTQQTLRDFREATEELLDDKGAQELFAATAEADREIVNGFYVAVPKSMIARAAGEFLRSSQAVRWFLAKPTAVWRAIVLNLRPAWLVNNIVGNHLLYAVRYAGPNGLRAYARAVKDMGKETSAFKKLVEDYFPEQIHGTFIDTQRPGRGTRLQNVVSGGLAPVDRAVERGLRRAAVETELRKHPAVRAERTGTHTVIETLPVNPFASIQGAVPKGHIRLYRGEGPKYGSKKEQSRRGLSFTSERFYAEHLARKNNGLLYYLDVPESAAASFQPRYSLHSYILPRELAKRKRLVVDGPEGAATARAVIRKQVPTLRRETRTFEQAARKALDKNPDLAREVSQKVNDALGDFLNLSPFEQNVLRSLAPFYAWYKAITRVILKMSVDTPGRADLLSKLGQVGAESTREALGEIPDFLLGAIPLHRDRARADIFNTTPLNPFATVPQLSQDISGTVNPLVAAAARAVLGQSAYDRVSPGAAGQTAGSEFARILRGLPPARLAEAFAGTLPRGTPDKPTLYRRDPVSELMAFLGAPRKNVSLSRAREFAREG